MIHKSRFYLMVVWMVMAPAYLAYSQKVIKGIVVDSLTLENLPGVHVKIRNSIHATATDMNGIFVTVASAQDTLVFSIVGYARATVKVNDEDELMIVRMREESIMLKEIIIRDRPPQFSHFESPTLQTTRPLPAAGVNLAYFSRSEREKRKLVDALAELDMVRTYVEIVNDPALREDIMGRCKISEERFYEILVLFNQTQTEVIHSANQALILSVLYAHFEKHSGKK